jgi:hypothetical protein
MAVRTVRVGASDANLTPKPKSFPHARRQLLDFDGELPLTYSVERNVYSTERCYSQSCEAQTRHLHSRQDVPPSAGMLDPDIKSEGSVSIERNE